MQPFVLRLTWIIILSAALNAEADSVLKVVPLQHRPAEELEQLLAPLLEQDERVVANNAGLIVKATNSRLPQLLALIKKLDAPLSNLLISVRQTRHETADQLNAEADAEFGINTNVHGRIRGHFGDTRSGSQRQDTQVIRTLEGKPAHIKTGQIHPTQTIQLSDSPYGSTFSTHTEFLEATTGFAVVPRLAGDNVILEISPWSDTIQRNGRFATSSADTTIRTRLGEWVEIGRSDSGEDHLEKGYLKHYRSTEQNVQRLLLKVDRID